MRALVAVGLTVICACGAMAQERGRYDPKTSYSVFVAYSNDSSHMILGESENRRLFAAGVDFSRRLGGRSMYSWRYQVKLNIVAASDGTVPTNATKPAFAAT